MTTTPMTPAATLSGARMLQILIAGSVATIAFDTFGQSISPLLGFSNLAPVPLAQQTLRVLTGINSGPAAFLIHILTGLIAYPLGWLLIAEPLRRRIWPAFPRMAAAVVYGVVLWVFALYVMAHLVAGNPPFLGWNGITWVALVGHVLFAVVMVPFLPDPRN